MNLTTFSPTYLLSVIPSKRNPSLRGGRESRHLVFPSFPISFLVSNCIYKYITSSFTTFCTPS
jgi:hypothetical protein